MGEFELNGIRWAVMTVDPYSELLIDRTGHRTVATTDPKTHYIYLSSTLQGPFLVKVLLHELGHCVMVSYGLLDTIRSAVYSDKWVEAEEWMCNFIADYGFQIFSAAYKVLGKDTWRFVAQELNRFAA